MPEAYSPTGPGVKIDKNVVPMIRTVIDELEKIGRQVVSLSSDLAFGSLIEKNRAGKPKTLIALQYDVWTECRKSDKRKLTDVIQDHLGNLFKICRKKAGDKMEMVRFTSHFNVSGLWDTNQKVCKPDLSEFSSARKSTEEVHTSMEWEAGDNHLSAGEPIFVINY